MRSNRILPLMAMVSLLGCDSARDWLREPATATAYAAPLASDTTVVTTRRVWTSASAMNPDLDFGTPMPNGDGIAVIDWMTGDPAVFDLASQELRRFRINGAPYDKGIALEPLASPDGGQIAFYWQNLPGGEEAEVSLRVVDVATGESRTLLAPESPVFHLAPVAWTPAGDSVFALMYMDETARDVKVFLTPAAGGTARLVHTIPGLPSFHGGTGISPDGRWLLYSHELSRGEQPQSDIYVIDVQSGGARPLVEHPAVDLVVGWLPGTDVFLFSSDRSGTTDLWSVRVVNGRASAEPRLVRSAFLRSQAVGFSESALFYGVQTGTTGAATVGVDPQSGALLGVASPPLEHLNTVPRGLAWSPDGRTLAAVTGTTTLRTITLHSMETGDSRVFWLGDGVHPYAAQWAADGKALFLRAGDAWTPSDSPTYFLRLDLVSGITTRLFAAEDPGKASPFSHHFRVTPDGRSVVLLQQTTTDGDPTGMMLVVRSLEDASERELHRTSGFIPEFSVSPDGTQLAFIQQAWEDADSLFVLRMDGSRSLRAVASWDTDEVSLLGWLPGGNAVLAASLTEGGESEEILRVALDGSTTVVGMSPFKPGRGQRIPGYNRSRLVLSPAGNRLAHRISNKGQELWRMDGLQELFREDTGGGR